MVAKVGIEPLPCQERLPAVKVGDTAQKVVAGLVTLSQIVIFVDEYVQPVPVLAFVAADERDSDTFGTDTAAGRVIVMAPVAVQGILQYLDLLVKIA